jgi:hypothetical protein
MKRLRWMSCVLLLGALAIGSLRMTGESGHWSAQAAEGAAGDVLPWQPDLPTAIRAASQQKLPLVIYFRADWCKYCQSVDKNVMTSEMLRPLAQKAIYVKITDGTKDPEEIGLRNLAKVKSYPTIAFAEAVPAANGQFTYQEHAQVLGEVTAELFEQHLRRFVTSFEKPGSGGAGVERTGNYLTASSAACEPDDTLCQLVKLDKELKQVDLGKIIDDVLKKEEGPWEGAITFDQLGAQLKELGYTPEKVTSGSNQGWLIRWEEQRGDYKQQFEVGATLSHNGRVIWLVLFLTPKRDSAPFDRALLEMLLRRTEQVGMAKFSLTSNHRVKVSISLLNAGITPRQLRFAVDEIAQVPRNEAEIWRELSAALMK